MSGTFSSFPLSVSPLPVAPWHDAHFDFQVRSVFFGSVWATAVVLSRTEAATSVAVRRTGFMIGPAFLAGALSARLATA